MNTTLLYACKIGDPDYMEEILFECKGYVNEKELIEKGKEWADNNGYNRLRIAKIDNQKPNFVQSINI